MQEVGYKQNLTQQQPGKDNPNPQVAAQHVRMEEQDRLECK